MENPASVVAADASARNRRLVETVSSLNGLSSNFGGVATPFPPLAGKQLSWRLLRARQMTKLLWRFSRPPIFLMLSRRIAVSPYEHDRVRIVKGRTTPRNPQPRFGAKAASHWDSLETSTERDVGMVRANLKKVSRLRFGGLLDVSSGLLHRGQGGWLTALRVRR